MTEADLSRLIGFIIAVPLGLYVGWHIDEWMSAVKKWVTRK